MLVAPIITISSPPGAGTTATAEATIGVGGTVTAVYVTNAGSGYTVAPTITFSAPGISTGNYALNETVTGSTSGTTAVVKDWDYDTGILKVYRADGKFITGEYIIGSATTITNPGIGVTGSYRLTNINYYGDSDDYRQNEEFEEASIDILDFSETNPFGNY